MRIQDALTALKSIRKDEKSSSIKEEQKAKSKENRLSTVWSTKENGQSVLQEYPRPQFQRRDWICLNGYWEYAFTGTSSRPSKMEGKILVPFAPESIRSGVDKWLEPGAFLWYHREVALNLMPGRRLILHFGAVDQKCTIWWNGKRVAAHENGYLPFSIDVTDVACEGKNTIWVRVEDDSDKGNGCRGKQTMNPGGMFYTPVSGIWQTVWMEWVPEKRVESMKITPLYDEAMVRLELTLTAPLDMEIQIFEAKENGASEGPAEATANAAPVLVTERISMNSCKKMQDGSFHAVTEIMIPEMKSWSPEHPFLYEFTAAAGKDRIRSYFAMRKFSSGTDEKGCQRLMLNNEPYFFNGILDQGYWPETLLTPPSEEAMVFDIEQMKRLGFNMMRKHIKIEPLRWYYHCDRIGMVVWQDMINGGGPISMPLVCYLPTMLPAVTAMIKDTWHRFFSRTDKEARQKWEQDLEAMIEHLYNCPSIGLWVPFNEGWGQFDSLRITKQIRKADPTRLIDHASGWFDQGGGDVKSVHNYFRPLKVEQDKKMRPFVLSEYGGYVCPVEGHLYCEQSYGYKAYKSQEAFTEAFRALQKQIYDLVPDGLCGAVYTQVSDIEEEINGIFTYDRKVCKVLE